jgi:hypothetical protein
MHMRRLFSRSFLTACATVVALAAIPTAAHGQQKPAKPQRWSKANPPLRADGEPDYRALGKAMRKQFNLFGNADFAVSQIKAPGRYLWALANNGEIDGATPSFFGVSTAYRDDITGPGVLNSFFFLEVFLASAPSVRDKIMATAGAQGAGLASALGGGFNVRARSSTNGTDNLLPIDNQLGQYFSGVTSTNDRSCLDHQGPLTTITASTLFTAGNPLLAGSDCPQTWGSLGWQGRKPVPQASMLARARLDPTKAFNFWSYPEGEPSASGQLEDQFGNFQTYGFFSDFSADELCGAGGQRTYGRVAPGCGDGDPDKPGYPLGIEIRIDAFNYAIPSLQDVVYYQITYVNKSADLYGTGVDYDSLYIGTLNTPYSDTQSNPVFYRPELNALFHTGVCSHQPPVPAPLGLCNGAVPVADLSAAQVTPPQGFPAYDLGSAAMVMLKSPIGDMRNKLFSRAGSPFAEVGAPATVLDDTITFNHGHLCGFRACARTTFATDDQLADHMQRQFGMVSSTENNVYGTRAPADLNNANSQILWHTFRSADWPALPPKPYDFESGSRGGFNRWIPGGWDYNNDGVQDTLYYDTCVGPQIVPGVSGCVAAFSDTMPHTGGASRRFRNGYSNTASVQGVGPFSLKAGDTTAIVFMIASACCGVADADSSAIMRKVLAGIDHYMNFYLGPASLPKDTVVAVDVLGGNQTQSQVTLTFTQTTENASDPFLLNRAQAIANAPVGTPDYILRKLNPSIVDTLLAFGTPFGVDTALVAANGTDTLAAATGIGNLQRIFVYKSCDGGVTWTASADCAPAPATGAPFSAVGWQPYATIDRDAGGNVSNTFTDANVNGGTKYTYALVTQTRGVSLSLQRGDAIQFTGLGPEGDSLFVCTVNCVTESLEIAPSLFTPLTASGSNVQTVYVPVSLPAGAAAPQVAITTVTGSVGSERITVTPTRARPDSGTFSLDFYEAATVVVTDTLDQFGRKSLFTQSIITATAGDATVTDTSVALGGIGISGASVEGVRVDSVVDENGAVIKRIRETTYAVEASDDFDGVIAVLSKEAGTDRVPLLVTSDLSDTATPETFASSAAYPGFTVGFENADLLSFNETFGEQFTGPNGRPIAPLVTPYVRLVTGTAFATREGEGGLYTITWQDKPWGPTEPFRVNTANPDATREAALASLNSRAIAMRSVVSEDVAAAIRADVAAGTAVTDLVEARIPFTIVNESFRTGTGGSTTPREVQVAMKRRASNNVTLGGGADTVTVAVPDTIWLPGDPLYLLEDTDNDPATPLHVTVASFQLSCTGSGQDQGATTAGAACNPVALQTPGGFGYISTEPGTVQQFLINPLIGTGQRYTISVTPQRTATDLAAACAAGGSDACANISASIRNVKVVPNPFVVFSNYINPLNATDLNKPLLFTNVPPRGTLRIYNVSGQFVQQITWTEADLNETGDLLWDLRTREGNLVAGGLYLFMITGKDAQNREIGKHMGKFVVIR